MVRVAAAHDQPLFARLLRSALAEQDAELVGIADSAAQAIRLVVELAPDVLVLDLALPGAFDVLDAVAENVQVVAVAPAGAAEERRRAIEAGVSAFIRSDAEPAEVAQALQLLGHLCAAEADDARRAPPPSRG
jgi:DNA-binding NarL/FixJ family response regulator